MLSAMCTHSGTICLSLYGGFVRRKVLRDVTRNFNRPFWNLPGFEYRRMIIILATLILLVRVPFLIFSRNYDESVVQTSAIATGLTRGFSSCTSNCVVSNEVEGWVDGVYVFVRKCGCVSVSRVGEVLIILDVNGNVGY